jgi:hypothetical protein
MYRPRLRKSSLTSTLRRTILKTFLQLSLQRCVPLSLILSDQAAASPACGAAGLTTAAAVGVGLGGGANSSTSSSNNCAHHAAGVMRAPVAPNTVLCPVCQRAPVMGIYMMPLSTAELDRAVEIRSKLVH